MSCIRVYVHAVWAVKYRDAVLTREMRPLLIASINGLLRKRGHTPIITNFEPDHVHTIFKFSCREDIGLAMKAAKGGSSKAINENFFSSDKKFRWQGGYGAFSVCPSHVESKKQYVRDQEIIHARRRFEEEYDQMIDECPEDLHDPEEHRHYFDPLMDREGENEGE